MVMIGDVSREVKSTTIKELLIELNINSDNIAVVKNGSIVSRKNWYKEKIVNSDKIDFFSPVGGG